MVTLATTALGRAGVALFVLVAVATLAYAIVDARRGLRLDHLLEPYGTGPSEPATTSSERRWGTPALVHPPARVTIAVARRLGILGALERLLENARVPVPAGEVLFFHICVVLLTVAFVAVASPGLAPILAMIITGLTPVLVLKVIIRRRQRAFAAQLPEGLRMLANSLRTGRSFLQGLQAVGREVDEPLASELGRVVAQARLGRSVEDGLDEVARRMASSDGLLIVAAIRMQRRIGGNLVELLTNVVEAIVARERLRGEVRALTAEGRISAMLLAILPLALAVVMSVVNPTYMSVLFRDGLGQVMVAGSCLLTGVGFVWMKKAMKVDV